MFKLSSLILLVSFTSTFSMKGMKEYLDMWNWETECWGESNVANWNKLEEQLIDQCLQSPVNEALRMQAAHASHTVQFQFQQPIQNAVPVQVQRNTYPFVNMYQPSYPFLGGMNSLYAHGRKKRASDAEWINASELKELWTMKVSNLTCFMKGMGVIDDNYNIKKDFLRNGVWEMKDLRATEHLSDSVWRNKISQYWVDCAEMAESIPDQVLDNCPMSRMFGPMARTVKFIMCKKVWFLLFKVILLFWHLGIYWEDVWHGSSRKASEKILSQLSWKQWSKCSWYKRQIWGSHGLCHDPYAFHDEWGYGWKVCQEGNQRRYVIQLLYQYLYQYIHLPKVLPLQLQMCTENSKYFWIINGILFIFLLLDFSMINDTNIVIIYHWYYNYVICLKFDIAQH